MSRDQKFFDVYSIVIGVLAAAALGIFVLVMKMSDLTQGVYTRDADEYQAAVEERIEPVGDVYRPDEEIVAERPAAETVEETPPVETMMTGPQVYNAACIACHGAGVGGAPVVGNAESWASHIAKGTDTLNDHAINGFTGVGYMPPKGGRMDLSDQEVIDAVAYMISESQ